ncbi:MAG: NAD(+) synthase [Synoicihabitans sp.]
MPNKSTRHGLLRVAVCSPELKVADTRFNANEHLKIIRKAHQSGATILVFPELSLTSYSCGDLFAQETLLRSATQELVRLAEATRRLSIAAIVGLPVAFHGKLFNCAAVVAGGEVLGLVPKTYLPTGGEFYEERWFTRGTELGAAQIRIGDKVIPFGVDLLFENQELEVVAGIEICEDLWAVNPPSGDQCLAGANLICNPSASDELLGKLSYRRDLVRQQSARGLSAYAYASAGPGESTTDVVYSGHNLICENGAIIAESPRFEFDSTIQYADIDLGRLNHERRTNSSFSASTANREFRRVGLPLAPEKKLPRNWGQFRPQSKRPFVPANPAVRAASCAEIFAIQSTALAKRLRHVRARNVVLGISGGLDSTLALLVTVHAFDRLGLDRKGIHAPTMPGFGTTRRTRGNAEELAESLGVTLSSIPIGPAVKQHFKDIGHDPEVHDVTYENSQARERTQILMDLANKVGGFVVGTGDLSESALGWCTFNGDHMSMYHVNIGVPKTLVQYLIAWCAETEFSGATAATLRDIIDTPISPELLPADAKGEIAQKTESVVGPYELHDFFLYHVVRHGAPPAKVVFLAKLAFGGDYPTKTLVHWLENFYRRFFSQQFKRSAMPDGPKVGTVALSPRGDWRMPSDAQVDLWFTELSKLKSAKRK